MSYENSDNKIKFGYYGKTHGDRCWLQTSLTRWPTWMLEGSDGPTLPPCRLQREAT